MYFLSKLYQIVLDRAVDTSVHGKDVVDGFNAVQKQYLDTCLRMCSMTEVYKIDSKHIHIDAMTNKGEVRSAKECRCLLNLCDEIDTKGGKKHAKCEAKSRLNHKYYWVHKEEYILFNGMNTVYNIFNNQDKVTMNYFYHIRCDPDLDEFYV